ncbi:unnamed protein product [Meganyctiphanes norvegica]|uniref:Uncharacterized protein n=1 Tax=Meganyctiphanes norvegica TaxID=48144 RepID=A0AAV2QCY4_MEGNR
MEDFSVHKSDAIDNTTVNESYYSIGEIENSKVEEERKDGFKDGENTMKDLQDMVQDEHDEREVVQAIEIQQMHLEKIEDEKSKSVLEQKTEKVQETMEIIAEDEVDNASTETEKVDKSLNTTECIPSIDISDSEEEEDHEIKSKQEEQQVVSEGDKVENNMPQLTETVEQESSITQDSGPFIQAEEALNQTEELDQLIFSDSEEEETENRKGSDTKQDMGNMSKSNKKSETGENVNKKISKDVSSTKKSKKSLNVSECLEPLLFSDSEDSDNESEKNNEKEETGTSTLLSNKEIDTNGEQFNKSLNSTEYIPSIDISDSEEEEELPSLKKTLSEEKVKQDTSAQKPVSLIVDTSKNNEFQKTEESKIQEFIPSMEVSVIGEKKELVDMKNKFSEKVEQQGSAQKAVSYLSDSSKNNELQKTEDDKTQESIPPIEISSSEEDKEISLVKITSEEKVDQQEIVQKPVSTLVNDSKKNEVQETEITKIQLQKENEHLREMDRPLEEFLSALQESPEKFLFREPEKVQEVHQSITSALDVKGPEKYVFCEPEVVQDVRNSPRVFVEVYHDARNPEKMVIEVKKSLRMTPDRSPRRGTPDRSPKRNTPDRSPRRSTPNRSPGRSTPNRSPGRATPDRASVNLFGEYQTLKSTSVHEKLFKNQSFWNYNEEVKESSTGLMKSTNDGSRNQKDDPIPVVEEPCVVKQSWKCGIIESNIISVPEAFKDNFSETEAEGSETKVKDKVVSNVEEVCIKETMWTCGEKVNKEVEIIATERQDKDLSKNSTESSTSIESKQIIQNLESMDVEMAKPEEEILQNSKDSSMNIEQRTTQDTEKASVDIPASVETQTLKVSTPRRSRRISESVDTDSTPNRRSKRIGTPVGTPIVDKPSTPVTRTRRNSTSVEMEASSPSTAALSRRTRRASINVEQPSEELGIKVGVVVTQDMPSRRTRRSSVSLETAAVVAGLPTVEVQPDVNADTTTTPATPSRRGRRSSISTEAPAGITEVKASSDNTTDVTPDPSTGTPATPGRRGRRSILSVEPISADVDLTPTTLGRRTRRTSLSMEQTIGETETTPVTPSRGRKSRQSLDPGGAATPSTTPRSGKRISLNVELPITQEEIKELKDIIVTSSTSPVSSATTPSTPLRRSSRKYDVDSPLVEGEVLSTRTRSSKKNIEITPSSHSKTRTPRRNQFTASQEVQQVTVNLDAALDTLKNISKATPTAQSETTITTITPVGTPITTPSKGTRKSLESPLTPVTTPSRRSKRLGPTATPTPGTPLVLEVISEESSINTSGELSANVTPMVTPHGTPATTKASGTAAKGTPPGTPAIVTPLGTPAAVKVSSGPMGDVEQSTHVSQAPTRTTPRKRHPSKPSTVVETLEPISEDVEIKASGEATEAISTPKTTRKDALVEEKSSDLSPKKPRGRPKKSLSEASGTPSKVSPPGTPASVTPLGTPVALKVSGAPMVVVEQSTPVSQTPTRTTPRKSHPSKTSTVVETLEPISEDVEIKTSGKATEVISTPKPTGKDALVEEKSSDLSPKKPRGRPKKSIPSGAKITDAKSTPQDSEKTKIDSVPMETSPLNKPSSDSSPKSKKESEDATPPSRPLTLRRSEASVRLLSPSVEVKTWSKRKSTRLSMFSTSSAAGNTTIKPRQSIAAVQLSIDEEDGAELTPQHLPKSRASRSMAPSDSFILIKTKAHEESISEQDSQQENISAAEETINDVMMTGGLDLEENTEETEGDKSVDSSPELSANLLVWQNQPEEAELEQHRRMSRRRTTGFEGQSLRRKLLKRSIQAVKLPKDGPNLDESSAPSDTKSRRSMRKSLRSVDSTILKLKSEKTIPELPEEEGEEDLETKPAGAQNDESEPMENEEDKKAKDFVFSSPIVEGRRVRKPPKRFSPSRSDDEEEEETKSGSSTKRKR